MLSTGTAGDWFKKLIVTTSALNVRSPCTRGADHFCSIFMISMVSTIPVTSPARHWLTCRGRHGDGENHENHENGAKAVRAAGARTAHIERRGRDD